MQIKIEPQPGHLLAVLSGSFNRKKLANAVKNIFAASSRHGLSKMLIDIRTLEGEIDFIARYEAGKLVADLQRETIRLVILGNKDQLWPDRFFEKFANNLGVTTKVTVDRAEALEWLHKSAADKSQ